MMTRVFLAVVCLLAAMPAAGQDLSKHFQGIDGTFVLLDGQTGAFTRWNAARADRRFAPCSTFKIPNTAILLETGAAADPEFVVKYDPALKASREAWRRRTTRYGRPTRNRCSGTTTRWRRRPACRR